MLTGSDLLPDEEVTAERQPAACPFCAYDGAVDGQGEWPDEYIRKSSGVESRFDVTWSQFHCPTCGGTWQMRTEAERQ